MRYYNEINGQTYSTADECIQAEEMELNKQAKEKAEKEARAAERKADAEKVEKARKELIKSQQAYRDALEAFVSKYKTYHYSTSSADEIPCLFDMFRLF